MITYFRKEHFLCYILPYRKYFGWQMKFSKISRITNIRIANILLEKLLSVYFSIWEILSVIYLSKNLLWSNFTCENNCCNKIFIEQDFYPKALFKNFSTPTYLSYSFPICQICIALIRLLCYTKILYR